MTDFTEFSTTVTSGLDLSLVLRRLDVTSGEPCCEGISGDQLARLALFYPGPMTWGAGGSMTKRRDLY
jgi:hypothetical protein